MFAIAQIINAIHTLFDGSLESNSFQAAVAASRQDDGSVAFHERSFLNLPSHERAAYLRLVRVNGAIERA